MFPDGNRTRVFPLARVALSQLSYQSITKAQRPGPFDDGQEASWVVNQLPGCTGFEPACGSKPLLPITQFIGPSKLARPMGIEPTSPKLLWVFYRS